MTDMTAEARMARAVAIVREQRDPDGEFGALGHPTAGPVAESVVEGLYLQEIERLQRAVMGEPDPEPEARTEIRNEDLQISYYKSDAQKRSRDAVLVPPIGVHILHVPSGTEARQSKFGSRLKNTQDAMRKLRRDVP